MPITDEELHRRVTRYEVMKRTLIIVTAVLVTIVLGLVLIGVNILVNLARDNHESLTTIKSCTQPTGHCYRDGQKRTSDAVANINRVIIAAAACSADLPPMSIHSRRDRIQACVIHQLTEQNR